MCFFFSKVITNIRLFFCFRGIFVYFSSLSFPYLPPVLCVASMFQSSAHLSSPHLFSPLSSLSCSLSLSLSLSYIFFIDPFTSLSLSLYLCLTLSPSIYLSIYLFIYLLSLPRRRSGNSIKKVCVAEKVDNI